MPVDFVYIIGIDSIGAAVETAYLSAEPDITRGDAGTSISHPEMMKSEQPSKMALRLRVSSCKFRMSSE